MICAAASLTGFAHVRQQARSQFADTPPFIMTTPLAGGTSVKVLPVPTGLAAMIIILKVLIMHKKDGVGRADHIMLL